MIQSISLLLLLLHSCSSLITSNPSTTFCDALKIKCDALPYRTVYAESNCYFVIDAKKDSDATAKQCSLALPGAQHARRAPDQIWNGLYVDKNDFFFAGGTSANKEKAMCIYENASPCVPDLSLSRQDEGTCSARLGEKQDQKFIARMIAEKSAQVSPVIVELKEKMEPGQKFTFNAIAKPGRNEFSLEFNSAGGANIAFIVYIQFAQRQIQLNSYANRAWGPAEIKAHTIQINQNFEVTIRTRADHFKICIDGKDFAEYKYRQPLSSITHFKATGYGFLNSYKLGEKKIAYPSVTGPDNMLPICNATAKGKCKSLIVSGILATEYKRVSINLIRRNEDIAIHFNPRFDEAPGFLIYDVQTSNNWWVSNRDIVYKPYPKQGEHIEVEFVNEEAGFQTFINGEAAHFFKHRMPSFDIVGVETSSIREPVITFREAKEQKFTAKMITEKTGQYSPVIVHLPENLEIGQEMIFNCIAKPGRNEYSIKLQPANGIDIAFIVYVQFSQRQIQFNSYLNMAWGPAEIKPHQLFIDRNFEVSIKVQDDHFKIKIDGKDFAEYKYRQPLSSITHFKVEGYGYLNSYKLGEKYEAYPSVPDVAAANSLPICKNSVSKAKCKSLVVSGILATEYQRVSINLIRKNDDIAIHFNPRYDQPPGFLLFDVQTSLTWWVSNRDIVYKTYPKQGEHIEVEFVNEEAGFQVYINGVSTHFFKHRMPSFDIVGVETSSIREPVITFK